MPRKPTRRRQLLKYQPITFSSFARSVALLASVYKVKRQIHNSKCHRKISPSSLGKLFINPAMEDKNEQPESSDGEEFEVVVQADFAFFDPKPDDFHGVKVLLNTYLDDKQWDLSGFVDLILGQTTVGTVTKIEEDEDDGVYAVVTALNLGRYEGHKCMVELKAFLLKVCQEKNILNSLRSLLGEQAQDVGLLVSQRVLNLPPQLLPPLYDALFDEVSWAIEDEHKNTDQKQAPSNTSDEPIIFTKPEDEIFLKLSSWSFTFPLRTQQPAAHELKYYRLMGLVMAVEACKVSTFREQLRLLINES